jgi:N-acetylglucosamine-6-sulfatase
MHSKMAALSLLLMALLSAFTFALAKRPNIIMILTDDQDRRLGSLDYMPNLQRLVLARGLTNTNHYGTVALCCPARATLLRGQAAHNTNITHVGGPGGGYPKFRHTGEMNDYLPLWLKKAGYTSAYIGKFMNGYNSRAIPPEGWDWLDILVSPWIYSFNHVVMKQNNAKPVYYDGWHQTDVLRIKALDLIKRFTSDPDGQPFYLEIAPASPHVRPGGWPTVPLARYKNHFPGVRAPRMPNWNPGDDQHIGKPAWVGELAQMNESVIESSDEAMRARLQGLQGVDEIVEDVVALLAQRHILQDTYSKRLMRCSLFQC